MKLRLNAKTLRAILFASMLLLFSGATAGFLIARDELKQFAASIITMESEVGSVDGNITALQQLGVTLEENKDIKAKADAIAVPASAYPVKVIATITGIANQSGVKLSSVNYGDAADATTPPTTGAVQTTPTAPTTPGVTTPAPITTTPSGATKKTINVTVQSPVNYDSFMKFLEGIETNDMYLHITKLSLAKAENDAITVQPFTIEVYTR